MFTIPSNSWQIFFEEKTTKSILDTIGSRLKENTKSKKTIFPPQTQIFNAFETCDLENLKVVLLGQDPYHGLGEAHGFAFSVPNGKACPPSLRNIFKELKLEYPEYNIQRSTDLSDWAHQGVLLLNSILTVYQDEPASHAAIGWELFTDHTIQYISTQKSDLVFILLGKFANSKSNLIDATKHTILSTTHPSPFSAYKGFLGSGIFRECNQELSQKNIQTIDW